MLIGYGVTLLMTVRIRVSRPSGPFLPTLPTFFLALSSLLVPSALLAFTLTLWMVGSQFGWTTGFFLVHGFFSHWQVWLGTAALLLMVSRLLERVARYGSSYSLAEE
jgi:hypothetical protein